MVRKVWAELGAGLGALGVLAIVSFGGVLVRAKVRAEERLSRAVDTAQEKQDALRELDARFAFPEPGEGRPLALDAQRLETYLAAREQALRAFERLQREQARGEEREDGAMDEARGRAERSAALQAALAESLGHHSMSPSEFSAITGQLFYAPGADAATRSALRQLERGEERLARAAQRLERRLEEDEDLPEPVRLALEKQQQSLERQREALEKRREALEKQREALQERLDAQEEATGAVAEDSESQAHHRVAEANARLRDRLRERLQRMASPSFDAFVFGDLGAADSAGERGEERVPADARTE